MAASLALRLAGSGLMSITLARVLLGVAPPVVEGPVPLCPFAASSIGEVVAVSTFNPSRIIGRGGFVVGAAVGWCFLSRARLITDDPIGLAAEEVEFPLSVDRLLLGRFEDLGEDASDEEGLWRTVMSLSDDDFVLDFLPPLPVLLLSDDAFSFLEGSGVLGFLGRRTGPSIPGMLMNTWAESGV
jgi:hypothetical protein